MTKKDLLKHLGSMRWEIYSVFLENISKEKIALLPEEHKKHVVKNSGGKAVFVNSLDEESATPDGLQDYEVQALAALANLNLLSSNISALEEDKHDIEQVCDLVLTSTMFAKFFAGSSWLLASNTALKLQNEIDSDVFKRVFGGFIEESISTKKGRSRGGRTSNGLSGEEVYNRNDRYEERFKELKSKNIPDHIAIHTIAKEETKIESEQHERDILKKEPPKLESMKTRIRRVLGEREIFPTGQ